MIATLPAVQASCKNARRHVCIQPNTLKQEKRLANRRHRRSLNVATRRMLHDTEHWWSEGFNAPSLSSWGLW